MRAFDWRLNFPNRTISSGDNRGGGKISPPPAPRVRLETPAPRGLTLALAGGGSMRPPLRFFEDSVKTAARGAAKFGTAYEAAFLQVI